MNDEIVAKAKKAALRSIEHLVRKRSYPEALPAEIAEWYVYLADAGHSIISVPACLSTPAGRRKVSKTSSRSFLAFGLPESDKLDDYLCPIPVKTVLRGYRIQDGFVVAEHAGYDLNLGVIVPEEDDEDAEL